MNSANLIPVTAFEEARSKARAAADAMVPLLATTLHAQFPGAAYLVLTRSADEKDYDELRLDSVRGTQGESVWEFDPYRPTPTRLPAVSAEIAALWGSYDPQDPAAVLNLAHEIDDTARYICFDFLPEEFRTAEEIRAGDDGGRTPLGISLPCPCGHPGGECSPCCGTELCPVVCSRCTPWRS